MESEPRENDLLWDLLGKAKQPVLPANFTDRVMQVVEAEQRGLTEAPTSASPIEAVRESQATASQHPCEGDLPPARSNWRARWAAAGIAAGLLVLIGLQSVPPASLRSPSVAVAPVGQAMAPVAQITQIKQVEEEQLVHEILSQGLSNGDLALLAQLHEVVDAELNSLWTDALQ